MFYDEEKQCNPNLIKNMRKSALKNFASKIGGRGGGIELPFYGL